MERASSSCIACCTDAAFVRTRDAGLSPRSASRRARPPRPPRASAANEQRAEERGEAQPLAQPLAQLSHGALGSRARRGQHRRLVAPLVPTLDLDLLHQQARAGGGDGDEARLGAAVAVERLIVVGGGDDPRQRRQRRADQIDAAHQLVGPAVDPHPVDEDRQHLERLRAAARGVGEAAGDVAEREPVGLAPGGAPPRRSRRRSSATGTDQLRLDDQVPLARHHRPPLLAPPVAVRLREAARRRAAEQEPAQHAVVDQASPAARRPPRRRSGRSRSGRSPPSRASVGSS